MATVTCPHCGAQDVPEGEFCDKCGKSLPLAAPGGPCVVAGPTLPSSTISGQLQGEQFRKKGGLVVKAVRIIIIFVLLFLTFFILAIVLGNASHTGWFTH